MKKIFVVLIMSVIWVLLGSTVYADPMDPLNQMSLPAVTTTAVGEAIQPNRPVETVTTVITKNEDDVDWEEEENKRVAVQFMDSVMFLVGMIGFVLPMIFMGLYLGARIYPSLFLPIFNFITRGKCDPLELSVGSVLLRTVPISTLGVLMATGWIRKIFAIIWGFIIRTFLS